MFRVIHALSDPGAADRANEDCFGRSGAGLFVIDGATGLSDTSVMAPEHAQTDAAWLAQLAALRLIETLDDAPSAADALRAASCAARDAFFAAGGESAPRYAWPTSAIQLLWQRPDGALETAGLGDCKLILEDAFGAVIEATGPQFDRAREQAAAQATLQRNGGFSARATLRDPETLAQLRASRARQNTPEGYWTLGLVPEAADHLQTQVLETALPARGVLMTDGLADLIELYRAYDAKEFIAAAFEHGLQPLCDELRQFEREIDPNGARFPRFKQSDDATALAFFVE